MAKIKEMIGLKFGKLTVLEKLPERNLSGRILYKCICDCGKDHNATGDILRSGRCKSCGCNRFLCLPPNKLKDRNKAIWKYLYQSTIIKRNKKFKINTDINLEEFILISKNSCFYCGLYESNFMKDRKKINKIDRTSETIVRYNGIDRVNSNLGYVKNNIVTCCKYCNTAKNTMTQEDFFTFIKRLYEYIFITGKNDIKI